MVWLAIKNQIKKAVQSGNVQAVLRTRPIRSVFEGQIYINFKALITVLLVGEGGLEPPRPYEHWHLKPARLPFRHSRE